MAGDYEPLPAGLPAGDTGEEHWWVDEGPGNAGCSVSLQARCQMDHQHLYATAETAAVACLPPLVLSESSGEPVGSTWKLHLQTNCSENTPPKEIKRKGIAKIFSTYTTQQFKCRI